MEQGETNWAKEPKIYSAHELPRGEVLLAADRLGVVRISARALGRLAGRSNPTVWAWLRGRSTSEPTDRAIREALGLALPSTRDAA